MKAAVLYGKQDVRIEEIAPATLHTGEVRIRIEAALTCGTDLKVFKRGYHARMIVPPAVFGHELAGIISEVGPGPNEAFSASQADQRETAQTPRWRVGDQVVVANSAPCGACYYCSHNQENLCEDLLFLNGAYAQSIIVPQRLVQKNLLRLKSGTSFEDAALVEPLACVVQGLRDLQLCDHDHVLVLGAGPIGLMFVALASQIGCDVTVAGRHEARLRLAQRLGAHRVIDIGDANALVTKIRQATSTHFDAVIEAVGQPMVWEAAVHLVRKGGTVNFFGGCPSGTTVTLDTTLIHYSNLRLLASFHHTPKTIREALDHVESGVIRAADFVNGECPLTRLPELFHAMANGNRGVKTLIRVHQ
jgi:L-iditol 2-dehydrogenase